MATLIEHRQKMETMYFEKHGKHPSNYLERAEAAREYWQEVRRLEMEDSINKRMEAAGAKTPEQKANAEKEIMSDLAKALVR